MHRTPIGYLTLIIYVIYSKHLWYVCVCKSNGSLSNTRGWRALLEISAEVSFLNRNGGVVLLDLKVKTSRQLWWAAVPLCIRDLPHSFSGRSVCGQRRIRYWVHQRVEEGCGWHFHGCGWPVLSGASKVSEWPRDIRGAKFCLTLGVSFSTSEWT